MRNAPLVACGALPETEQKVLIESVRHATVTTVDPRRTGCPMGCGQHGHEPPCTVGRPLRLSCHACGSLDWSARESLHDCSAICPMQAVAS